MIQRLCESCSDNMGTAMRRKTTSIAVGTNDAKGNWRIDKALFLRLKFGDTSTRNEQILREWWT